MLQNLIITFVQSVRHQVSHSSTLRVEEELNKLKTLETAVAPTAETICNSLLGLKELYKYINDLNLHLTFQALSHCKHEKLVEDLLDKSVRLLDVCYTTKEPVSQCKENVRDLQSYLRMRKGDLSTESGTADSLLSARR
ncbi:uncharacterized protein [Nicotiana tomentosiformis]|uniref:uncharacterized protein n=1 Tax=Nicotiana tomentosiformis TaxID=4098 RepID=UPI00051B32D0